MQQQAALAHCIRAALKTAKQANNLTGGISRFTETNTILHRTQSDAWYLNFDSF